MNKKTRHKDSLEKSRGLIMQISIIASLLIVLIVFESRSSQYKEDLAGFTEINLEIDKYKSEKGNIKPPAPNSLNMGYIQRNVRFSDKNFENINLKFDKQAHFIGGEQALRVYFSKNKQYSEDTKKKDIQGRVNVNFIIDKNGKIKNAKVIRSIHPLIDTEALRLINAMPDWKPAELNGEQVESKQILPIIFINN